MAGPNLIYTKDTTDKIMTIATHKNEFQDWEIRFVFNQLSKNNITNDIGDIDFMPIQFLINFLQDIEMGELGQAAANCIIHKLNQIQKIKQNGNIENH